jgi:protein tyrosine phosphatase (PTP) superfamily phosphohydrolase (DUF442 family)
MNKTSQIGGRSGNPFIARPWPGTRTRRKPVLLAWRKLAGRPGPARDTANSMSQPAPPPSAGPVYSGADRLRLYWLKDHGFLRVPWTNFHKLDADVWRHNHPSPARLAQLKAMGAVSVLTLRGSTSPPSVIEARACAELGLTFRALEMRATILPRREALLGLLDAFREMPKPMVVHCKSGSDRTGLASVLYLHVFKGVALPEARGQLSLRYIHNPLGRARVINRLLDAYDAEHRATGIGFENWLRDRYDPAALMVQGRD